MNISHNGGGFFFAAEFIENLATSYPFKLQFVFIYTPTRRFLTVWSGEREGSALPLQSLAMDHEPTALHLGSGSDSEQHQFVVAATKANAALVWRLDAAVKSAKAAKKDAKSATSSSSSASSSSSSSSAASAANAVAPIFRVALAKRAKASAGADDVAVLGARFASGARAIVIASGSASIPHFDTVVRIWSGPLQSHRPLFPVSGSRCVF